MIDLVKAEESAKELFAPLLNQELFHAWDFAYGMDAQIAAENVVTWIQVNQ